MPGGMPPSAKQEVVAANERSFTGQYLRETLEKAVRPEPVEGSNERLLSKVKKGRKKASADEPDLLAAK